MGNMENAMKLDLIKMPNYRKADWHEDNRLYRKYIISINDVIVETLQEANRPFMSREAFDQWVGERVATFEIALNVKARRIRGVE